MLRQYGFGSRTFQDRILKSILYLLSSLIVVAAISSVFPCNVSAQISNNNSLTPREIAKQSLPSVVLLIMENSRNETGKTGSGFFVAQDIVATNLHVITNCDQGVVKIVGQETLYDVLGVVAADEKNDLALLKVARIKGRAMVLSSDDSTSIGDAVFAVGNPQGLEGTFSQGIVSSIRKSSSRDLIQITAPISEGSSGGAVMNDRGEVIGVAVGAIESGQSLNFAIPVSALRALVLRPLTLIALSRFNAKTIGNQASSDQRPANKQTTGVNAGSNVPNNIVHKFKFRTGDLWLGHWTGRVRSIRFEVFLPSLRFGEWIQGNLQLQVNAEFDRMGNETRSEATFFEPSSFGSVIGDDETLGYPNSRIRETRFDQSSSINSTMLRKEFVKCAACDRFSLKSEILMRYTDNENSSFNEKGELLGKTVKSESKNGRKIQTHYSGDGSIYSQSIDYALKGNKIREYWEWSKDEQRLVLLSSDISTDRVVDGGVESLTIAYYKGKELYRTKTLEDKTTGLQLRRENTDLHRRFVTKNNYEYDSAGNWIRETELKQVTKFGKTYFEPSRITIRVITYY